MRRFASVLTRSVHMQARATGVVNQLGVKQPLRERAAPVSVVPGDASPDQAAILAKHEALEASPLSPETIQSELLRTTLTTWGATAATETLQIANGEGIYLYDTKGKEYIDWNSGAMCVNLGHSVPKEVVDAVTKQLETAPYAYPCHQSTEIKARLGALIADIMPGDLNHSFFTCGGAESNEAAMRMAKVMTGRPKLMARYRSYHGGSLGTMALTGDPRRWATEPSIGGVVRVMDPDPYHVDFGATEEEITENCLKNLDEVIMYEGGHNIAAFFLESVTGTNGVLKPPKGYLEGVRSICDEHGILMVCDEVMAGFGRTGKWFGFMHSDPCVIPDIVTTAKGINGAYVPLGAAIVRDHVADYFMDNPIQIGTTYNSHPVALASAYEALKWTLRNDVVGNSARLEPVMQAHMEALADKHPCVRSARSVGLFGMIDFAQDNKGTPFVAYNGPPHPAMAQLNANLRENGLFTLFRWSSMMCNPPLIINEDQIADAFDIIDKSLAPLDEVYATNVAASSS